MEESWKPHTHAICPEIIAKNVWSDMQGPPGTGKTSTIVAMVSSFLNRSMAVPSEEPSTEEQPSCCRVLVCAQSNAAVDELALRLSKGLLDGSGKPRYEVARHMWT